MKMVDLILANGENCQIRQINSIQNYPLYGIGCFTNHCVNIRATCTRDAVPHNVGSFVGKCCLHTVLLNYLSKLLFLGGDIGSIL